MILRNPRGFEGIEGFQGISGDNKGYQGILRDLKRFFLFLGIFYCLEGFEGIFMEWKVF